VGKSSTPVGQRAASRDAGERPLQTNRPADLDLVATESGKDGLLPCSFHLGVRRSVGEIWRWAGGCAGPTSAVSGTTFCWTPLSAAECSRSNNAEEQPGGRGVGEGGREREGGRPTPVFIKNALDDSPRVHCVHAAVFWPSALPEPTDGHAAALVIDGSSPFTLPIVDGCFSNCMHP
jgi:hypothetical protein